MTQYVVQPGDSPAKIAGQVYGDQRRYIDLINANGGNWHPGQVIDIPDITGTPSPTITNAQWAATQTGYSGGKAQYGNSAKAPQAGGPATPQFGGPQTPNFGSAGTYDSRTGAGQGTSPWGVQTPPVHGTYGPNSAGTYDSRVNRNAGVTGGGAGAMPANLPAYTGPHGGGGGTVGPREPVGREKGTVPAQTNIYGNPATQGGGLDPTLFGVGPRAVTPGGAPNNLRVPNSVKYQQNPISTSTNPNALGTRTDGRYTYETGPGPSIPYDQQRGGWNAANGGTMETLPTFEALTAYAGGFDGSAKGDRTVLPSAITSRVANQIPLPPGFSSISAFMTALGYTPDASGNWVKQMPARNQGYGGGSYGTTQTYSPASYSGYGGYGGYGYSGWPSASGSHTAIPSGRPMGLVAWRIGA